MGFYDFTVKDVRGTDVNLADYRGIVVLVVNTATKCGFTPQYEGLEKLYERFHARGFEILDFPCNQFAGQAPGSDGELAQFCQLRYHTTFTTFAKIKVNGRDASPLYVWLKSQRSGVGGSRIKWNFTKFLINRGGAVVERYASQTEPEKIADRVAKLLAVPTPSQA